MRVKGRWCLLVAIGLTVLAPAAPAASATRALNPKAAARVCSDGRALGSVFNAGDTVFLGDYLACVTRRERAQLGLRFTQSRWLAGRIRGALSRFFASNLRIRHEQHQADRAVLQAARAMASKGCGRAGATFSERYGDTSPPSPTLLEIARGLAGSSVLRAPKAIFGMASRQGVLFENHNAQGAMFLWVGVVCH